MIILSATPGSPEHMAARLGIPTASMASQILTSGGAPTIPQHYRVRHDYDIPPARAKRQREIVAELTTFDVMHNERAIATRCC